MNLVVFDIDGTLVDSAAVDTDACFVPALQEGLGISGFGDDWTAYAEPTSAGIFDEVIRKAFKRPPLATELGKVQTLLDTMMRARYLGADRIPPMAGALAMLNQLAADKLWRVAIATGNWRQEAAIKIESAGLLIAALPMATSTDRLARREILPLAIARASERYETEEWHRAVYVGDGVWDARVARELGMAFVGIGKGNRAAALRREGAGSVLADFTDLKAFWSALNQARVPEPPGGAP